MVLVNKVVLPEKTLVDLKDEPKFQNFMKKYLALLKKSMIKVKLAGLADSGYYTCGQDHDSRNPNWKPFAILWKFSEKKGYDFYIVKDILEEHLGRKLNCECEVLTDPRELKRRRLEHAGVFLDSGDLEF
jgi:hypothetical protein